MAARCEESEMPWCEVEMPDIVTWLGFKNSFLSLETPGETFTVEIKRVRNDLKIAVHLTI